MLFYGKYEHSLDNKYRLRIPSRLREELFKDELRPSKDNPFCIAKNDEGSLVIFPASTIKKLERKFKTLVFQEKNAKS